MPKLERYEDLPKSLDMMCKGYARAYASTAAAEFAIIMAKERNVGEILGKGYRKGVEKFMIEVDAVLYKVAMKQAEGGMDITERQKIEKILKDVASRNLGFVPMEIESESERFPRWPLKGHGQNNHFGNAIGAKTTIIK